jgi:predicted patatin/cPLA2 family phospholipase
MKYTLLFSAILLLSACAQTVIHHPLSTADYEAMDFADAGGTERWWGDALPPDLEAGLRENAKILRKRFPEAVHATQENAPVQNILALSGGGANGAFGAGVLVGWSESGQRPEFEMVTGSSTGSIIAPFAFLGSEYDDVLLEIYSSVTRDDIYQPKILTGLLSGSALADTTSLQNQIEKYVTQELVAAIAVEYQKNRTLFMVTTHFDAMRPMIWNIGAIATNGGPDATALIRKVILASSAIPIMFPPVPIEWEKDGKHFTELHVDGGVTRNVFAYPAQISVKQIEKIQGLTFRKKIFVIQNSNSQLRYEPAKTGVMSIAGRAVKGLLQNKGNADVERIYYLSQRDDIAFNMIEIPNSFVADGATDFDPDYIAELLALGRATGKRGDFWYDKPPSER